MFGLLKKKISSFIDNLTQKEAEKPDEGEQEPADAKVQGRPMQPAASRPPQPTAPAEIRPPASPGPSANKEPIRTPGPQNIPSQNATSIAQPGSVQPPQPAAPEAEPKPASVSIATPPRRPATPASRFPEQPETPTAISMAKTGTEVMTPEAKSEPAPSGSKPTGLLLSVKDALFGSKPQAPKEKPEPPALAEPDVKATADLTPKMTRTIPTPSSALTAPRTSTVDEAEKTPQTIAPMPKAQEPAKTENAQPVPKPPATPTTIAKTMPLPDAPKERKLEAKLGLLTQIKGLLTREVQIQTSELEPMLDELNMALLESDVTLDTAEHIVSSIKIQLAGRKVDKSRVQAEIQSAVKAALVDVLDKPELDLLAYIRSRAQAGQTPVKILLLGPNGAGKTTTLAKIAHYLKQNGIRCVLAAGDTFRAAAIEQLQHHGTAIGVPVIKHQYGADPAAVAFDAIAHAKAHGLDVVLIDTAGRQETNLNLLKEMEKINRVVAPDLKLFIGEAVAGHALVEQAKTFHAALKLDGVILTKVDCDAKGGTSFSVAHEVGVPIVLLGTGQNYGDIRPFNAKWLISNVLAE